MTRQLARRIRARAWEESMVWGPWLLLTWLILAAATTDGFP